MEHFRTVERICRTALAYSGGAREVETAVQALAQVLKREEQRLKAGGGRRGSGYDAVDLAETSEQAGTIVRLLERHRPETGVATAQTVARLRQDTVQMMFAKGVIGAEQVRAAAEIREIFEALTSGMLSRSSWPGDPAAAVARASRGKLKHPAEHMPGRIHDLFHKRYKRWSREAGRALVVRSNIYPYSALAMIIDVLIDGTSMSDLSFGFGTRRHEFAKGFVYGLRRYAEIAGWLKIPDQERGWPVYKRIVRRKRKKPRDQDVTPQEKKSA